jgi:protein-S-isoprenylcysteine O-methyltransferase Ste14
LWRRAERLGAPEFSWWLLAHELPRLSPVLVADTAQRLALRLKRRVAFERKMLARTASGRRRGAWAASIPPLALAVLGALLIVAGVTALVSAFARFVTEGLGTPAPIAPTQKLVVTGLYRYVRNPIYIAVVAVIFGQALLFGDWRLLWYGALLWLFFHVWVVMIEEPTLKQTFGTEYESFRTHVPRWIPRLTAWRAA